MTKPIFKDDEIEIYSVNDKADELVFVTHGGWNPADKETHLPDGTSIVFYFYHSLHGKNGYGNDVLKGTPPKVTSIGGGKAKIWNYGLYEDDRQSAKNLLKDYLDKKPAYAKAGATTDVLIVVGEKCLMSHLFDLITKKKIKPYKKIHFTACRVIHDDNMKQTEGFTWEHIDKALDKLT